LIGDASYYHDYAWKVATGTISQEVLQYHLSPVYLAFLSFFYSLFGHHALIPRFVQMLLGSLSCVLLYQTGKTIWDEKTGLLAGFLAAFYGIFIFYDSQILKPSLVNFLVAVTFYALTLTLKKTKILLWVLAAFAFTTAIFLRRHLAVFVPAVFVWIFMAFYPKKKSDCFFYMAVFCLVSLLTAGLWNLWLRKHIPNQQLLMTQSGIHFYIAHNPDANGTYNLISFIRPSALGHAVDAQRFVEAEKKRKVSAEEVNQYWFQKGIDYILKNPGDWLVLELKKLFLIFNAYEIPNDENYDYTRKQSWFLSLPFFSFGLIAPLGLAGLWLGLRKSEAVFSLLALFVAAYVLSLLSNFVTGAYRLPVQLPLILSAAYALVQIPAIWESMKWKEYKGMGIVLLVLFLFCNYQTYLSKCQYESYMNDRIQSVQSRTKYALPPPEPQAFRQDFSKLRPLKIEDIKWGP
jgi:4-amino-4-deoxy-L-arabinose transferase-like glycosyltransferase